jgi:hypothetical protein
MAETVPMTDVKQDAPKKPGVKKGKKSKSKKAQEVYKIIHNIPSTTWKSLIRRAGIRGSLETGTIELGNELIFFLMDMLQSAEDVAVKDDAQTMFQVSHLVRVIQNDSRFQCLKPLLIKNENYVAPVDPALTDSSASSGGGGGGGSKKKKPANINLIRQKKQELKAKAQAKAEKTAQLSAAVTAAVGRVINHDVAPSSTTTESKAVA